MVGAIFSLMFSLALGGVSSGFAQSASEAEKASIRAVGAFHVEQFGAYRALADISQKAGVSIGVDAVQPEKEIPVEFDFPGGTLAELLDACVAQAPEYQWVETAEGGPIRVSRSGGHVPLLDVVMHYPGADMKTREEIWEDIARRPEVFAWMNSAHCSRREFFQGGEFKRHNQKISISPASLSVAQLLDQVATKSGENYWAVLETPPGSECRISLMLW
jgi:hypothetical protein